MEEKLSQIALVISVLAVIASCAAAIASFQQVNEAKVQVQQAVSALQINNTYQAYNDIGHRIVDLTRAQRDSELRSYGLALQVQLLIINRLAENDGISTLHWSQIKFDACAAFAAMKPPFEAGGVPFESARKLCEKEETTINE